MTDKDIFQHLFTIASESKDPRGVVVACLVEDGAIIDSSPSSDDGIHHAEDILFQRIKDKGIKLSKNTILYATLEPCTKRTKTGMTDCVSSIIDSGIGKVIYGARDPEGSVNAKERLNTVGIEINQIQDVEIVERCAVIFNSSVAPEHIDKDVKLKPLN